MIAGAVFDGDLDAELIEAQEAVYGAFVGHLFSEAIDRYLERSRRDPEMARRLKGRVSFDHRILQAAHDRIAAEFRFRHGGVWDAVREAWPGDFDEWRGGHWRRWFIEEVASLTDDEAVTTAIATAAAFENQIVGTAAEHRLARMLDERYGVLPGCTGWPRSQARFEPFRTSDYDSSRHAEECPPIEHRLRAVWTGDLGERPPHDSVRFEAWTCKSCGLTPFELEIRHYRASQPDAFRGIVTRVCAGCGRYEAVLDHTGPTLADNRQQVVTDTVVPVCPCGERRLFIGQMERHPCDGDQIRLSLTGMAVATVCPACKREGIILLVRGGRVA